MRIRATKEGLKMGPEYFPKEVLLQVLPTWSCQYDEVVLHGTVYYAMQGGMQIDLPNKDSWVLKNYLARMGEFLQARHDLALLKQDAIAFASTPSMIEQIRIVSADDAWTYGEPVIVKFGNCHARRWRWKRGEGLTGHTHFFDHMALLIKGSASVVVSGIQTIYTASRGLVEITVPADEEHSVTALEDDTRWYCVFADRDAYGQVDVSGQSFDLASTQ